MVDKELARKYEKEVHPWADDTIIDRIVEDEIKANPEYQHELEEWANGESEKGEHKGKGVQIIISLGNDDVEDPFPEEEEEEEESEEDDEEED